MGVACAALGGGAGPRAPDRAWCRDLGLGSLLVLVLLGGCGRQLREAQARALGGLVIDCQPADAQVFVDERYHGQAGALRARALRLRPGRHSVELRRPGYFASYHEVSLVTGVRQRLVVRLRATPF